MTGHHAGKPHVTAMRKITHIMHTETHGDLPTHVSVLQEILTVVQGHTCRQWKEQIKCVYTHDFIRPLLYVPQMTLRTFDLAVYSFFPIFSLEQTLSPNTQSSTLCFGNVIKYNYFLFFDVTIHVRLTFPATAGSLVPTVSAASGCRFTFLSGEKPLRFSYGKQCLHRDEKIKLDDMQNHFSSTYVPLHKLWTTVLPPGSMYKLLRTP